MKTLLTSLLAIAACCLLAGPVSGQDVALDDAGCCDVGCCDDVCCDAGCGTCCDCSGIVIGAELMWLDVFAKEGAGGGDPDRNGSDNLADWDYETGFRIWAGYEFSNGLGIRFRWFSYDHAGEFTARNGNQTDTVVLDIDMYDIELTDDLNIGCWELTPSIGVRWGEIDMNNLGNDLDSARGVGAVVGLEARRYLGNCWSLYANTHYGVLYGDADDGNDGFEAEDDIFFETIELQVGLEWAQCTASGANLFARVGWEQQMYLVDELFDIVNDDTETGDISLAGPAIAIGLDR